MGTELNPSAYRRLLEEDLDWLVANCPGSLERSHIEMVLLWVIKSTYDNGEYLCPHCQARFDVEVNMWVCHCCSWPIDVESIITAPVRLPRLNQVKHVRFTRSANGRRTAKPAGDSSGDSYHDQSGHPTPKR